MPETISKIAGLDDENKLLHIIDGSLYIVLSPSKDETTSGISLYGCEVDPYLYIYALGFMHLLEHENELVAAAGKEQYDILEGKSEGQL